MKRFKMTSGLWGWLGAGSVYINVPVTGEKRHSLYSDTKSRKILPLKYSLSSHKIDLWRNRLLCETFFSLLKKLSLHSVSMIKVWRTLSEEASTTTVKIFNAHLNFAETLFKVFRTLPAQIHYSPSFCTVKMAVERQL